MKLIYKIIIFGVFCSMLFGINGLLLAAGKSHARAAQVITESSDSGSVTSKTVNINDADAASLEKVKGIGPKKAEAIIKYRDEHGKFQSVDDLTKVKGIGKKRLEKMKHSLTV